MKQSIAITGSGIICAIGTDNKSVLDSLYHNRSGIEKMQYLDTVHKNLLVGEVKMSNNELKEALNIDTDEEISRTTLLGAHALQQAITDSGLNSRNLENKRITFLSGTTVGGMDITEKYFSSMLNDSNVLKILNNHDCGSCSENIVKLSGLKAEISTISTACSSALNAIILGTRMLLNNETDIVIAGGTEALSRFHLNGFKSLMIFDSERCRPFDAERQGLNLGEGAAYIVLERSNETNKAKAYIAGYGNRCDAFHQTASSENGEGAYLAMSEAIKSAGLKPELIDYINAHGTGTGNNDNSESQAVKRVFGENIPPISSTKSFTGHTTSASGAIEAVICMLCISNNFIPANLGWKNQDENCVTPSSGEKNKPLDYVLCNSFGFGGNDSSLLISSHENVIEYDTKGIESEIAAENEIKGSEELAELKQFISPLKQRRMDKLTKAALLTSFRAINAADVDSVDAIIIATSNGMLSNSEKIMQSMEESGEEDVSPALFMQSTHNTIAGIIATQLKCHGYNITYTQGKDSLDWAIRDARRLISEGQAKSVLVGLHEECTPLFASFLKHEGKDVPDEIYSKSIVLKAKNT